jgi:hypothetical protein
MPDAALGFVGQDAAQRRVNQLPLPHAGTLEDRRAHQGVAELHAVPAHLVQSCGDRRDQVVRRRSLAGDDLGGCEGFRDQLTVVMRRNQQQQASCRRQSGHPRRECALQPGAQRKPGRRNQIIAGLLQRDR